MTLTGLQEALARAHGLAMTASSAIEQVEQRVDAGARADLRRMHDDCGELRVRCSRVEATFGDAAATEMTSRAQRIHERGVDLINAWFTSGTDPVEAWIFLAMADAAQVVAWRSLAELADADPPLRELIDDALQVCDRHLHAALTRR